jgi:hypothetical protein
MANIDPNDPDFGDHGPDVPDVDPATTFYINRRGNRVVCRIAALDACADDPMNAYAPMGDIYNDCRRADLRDGCPACIEGVTENASEPDVMARWGLR